MFYVLCTSTLSGQKSMTTNTDSDRSHDLFGNLIHPYLPSFTYPLTARVVEFSPFFSVSHCHLGLCELQACLLPDVVFPSLPLSALSSLPLSPCLTRWFWPDLMNGRLNHTTAVCISLRRSGGLGVVQLPVGSWHGSPRW